MNDLTLRAELKTMLRGTTWAIAPEYLTVLHDMARGGSPANVEGMAKRPAKIDAPGNVAVLNLTGVITPKPSFMQMLFGGTAMTEFATEIQAAADDRKVSAIVMNVDSPGGRIDLVPETAALIRTVRETKPVIAVANTYAASAAYWLASQASDLVVTPSGEVGSIGEIGRASCRERV